VDDQLTENHEPMFATSAHRDYVAVRVSDNSVVARTRSTTECLRVVLMEVERYYALTRSKGAQRLEVLSEFSPGQRPVTAVSVNGEVRYRIDAAAKNKAYKMPAGRQWVPGWAPALQFGFFLPLDHADKRADARLRRQNWVWGGWFAVLDAGHKLIEAQDIAELSLAKCRDPMVTTPTLRLRLALESLRLRAGVPRAAYVGYCERDGERRPRVVSLALYAALPKNERRAAE